MDGGDPFAKKPSQTPAKRMARRPAPIDRVAVRKLVRQAAAEFRRGKKVAFATYFDRKTGLPK
jgi:hypothetical protein